MLVIGLLWVNMDYFRVYPSDIVMRASETFLDDPTTVHYGFENLPIIADVHLKLS